LTKKGQVDGDPVRPKFYRGTGHTYDFGKAPKARPPKR
jgi:guanidinobutyrase